MMSLSVKEVLGVQANIECGFTLKSLRDMIKIYSQMHHTDKHSQHSSIICPVSAYKLGCSRLKSFWVNHLKLEYGACFEQVVPWNSSKYRVWIHSETRTWHHDKNIQSNAPYRKVLATRVSQLASLAKLFNVCLGTK